MQVSLFGNGFNCYSDIFNASDFHFNAIFTLLLSRYNRTPAKFSICYIFTFTQISKELDRFSLTSEVKQAILDCVWPRQEEVRQMLVFNAASISNSYLKDFDWKVKVHATFDYT